MSYARWIHILDTHPEFDDRSIEDIRLALSNPELVQEGDQGALLAVRRFLATKVSDKYLVVVYHPSNAEGRVITSYYASTLRRARRTIWHRP